MYMRVCVPYVNCYVPCLQMFIGKYLGGRGSACYGNNSIWPQVDKQIDEWSLHTYLRAHGAHYQASVHG